MYTTEAMLTLIEDFSYLSFRFPRADTGVKGYHNNFLSEFSQIKEFQIKGHRNHK